MSATSAGRREKASIRLARDIVRTMYEAGMQPGDRYLPESEALKRHGVGRATLREALRYLEIQGVLEVRAGPGGGPMVTRPGWPSLASTLALMLQFTGSPFVSVLEARSAIEPGMAELAARHATAAQLTEMAAALDRAEAQVGDYRRFHEAYLEFWRTLAASTANPVIAYLSPALRAIVDSAGFVPNEPYRLATLRRLRGVLAAVEGRDPEAARRAMVAVEDAFLERLTTHYPRQMERVVAWSDLDLDGA
jgi:DNA-binding FadR family transcriptional regulator